ncbi:MAG: helix-turn-helix domain-containing protein [Holosporales bacterium]|jgi:transcriptional regulator with XRE-family HTH domain|nr:helix-turn-helix domain-containing protein [Holosporales bacterium]
MNEHEPPIDPISRRIGAFIKHRRIQLGLTQRNLAQMLGITAQQVQKYESGANSLRITRFVQLSKVLSCPLKNFLLMCDDVRWDSANANANTSANASNDALNEESAVFVGTKNAHPSDENEPFDEIDNFFGQFLSLGEKQKEYVMEIVDALAKRKKLRGSKHPSKPAELEFFDENADAGDLSPAK